jgi:hypothetical protein
MRIAGNRLNAPVVRLLSEILRAEGFPAIADKVADALKNQVTGEPPLTLEDHEVILEVLNRRCPATLYRLRERLLEEQRYIRRATDG